MSIGCDGVYLLPDRANCRSTLETISADIVDSGGTAMLVGMTPPTETGFEELFDRSAEYATLIADIAMAKSELSLDSAGDVLKQARKFGKVFAGISDTDFFPSEAHKQTEAALWTSPASVDINQLPVRSCSNASGLSWSR